VADGDAAPLRRWRDDTPGTAERIHLNNAGAALMPRPVIDAIAGHLELEARIGGYEASAVSADAIRATYAAVGAVIGAPARNVAIVENATVAVAQALSAFDFERGDAIVTTRSDYTSNQLMYLALAERFGVDVVRAEDLP
jgi:selenocysteine lyase/cysteine desulfurase